MTEKEKEIRKKRVSAMIAEFKSLFPVTGTVLEYSNSLELLIAVILSAQCTDKQVNIVTKKLFQKYRTLDDYLNANLSEFEQDIKSTGFYRNKAKNILAAVKVIDEEFKGELPRTIDELITLPGVGRKTANVVLGNAYGIHEGIAVDTHVKRLSRKFQLTDQENPDKIEQDLMQIIPKEYWFTFTYWLIEYGRNYSPARKVNDETDPLSIVLKKKGLL